MQLRSPAPQPSESSLSSRSILPSSSFSLCLQARQFHLGYGSQLRTLPGAGSRHGHPTLLHSGARLADAPPSPPPLGGRTSRHVIWGPHAAGRPKLVPIGICREPCPYYIKPALASPGSPASQPAALWTLWCVPWDCISTCVMCKPSSTPLASWFKPMVLPHSCTTLMMYLNHVTLLYCRESSGMGHA